MKLTKTKILETIRRKNQGWTTYQVRKIAGISIRRVNQIWKEYQKTGEIPEIGKKNGRPRRPITSEEREIVRKAYREYRVSASTLEKLIGRDYGIHIPHNHIHKIMVLEKLSKPLKIRHKRKKDWIRYERRHSLTAVHVDWYYDPIEGKWVFAVLDDASRYLLALLEVKNATTDASIEGMKKALRHGEIKQIAESVITGISNQTGRNIREGYFPTEKEAEQFFSGLGFSIEKFPFYDGSGLSTSSLIPENFRPKILDSLSDRQAWILKARK